MIRFFGPARFAPGLFVDRGAKVGYNKKKIASGCPEEKAGRIGKRVQRPRGTAAVRGRAAPAPLQCLREGGAGRGTQAGRPAH